MRKLLCKCMKLKKILFHIMLDEIFFILLKEQICKVEEELSIIQ